MGSGLWAEWRDFLAEFSGREKRGKIRWRGIWKRRRHCLRVPPERGDPGPSLKSRPKHSRVLPRPPQSPGPPLSRWDADRRSASAADHGRDAPNDHPERRTRPPTSRGCAAIHLPRFRFATGEELRRRRDEMSEWVRDSAFQRPSLRFGATSQRFRNDSGG